MTDELKAIEQYVEIIRATLPDSFPGDGPVYQALGEIVAEATALDSALDSARSDDKPAEPWEYQP